MIRARVIGHLLGQVLLALSGAMLIPVFYAVTTRDGGAAPLLAGLLASAIAALALLFWGSSRERDLSSREAFLLVSSVCLGVSLIGAIPYYVSPHFDSFTDSIFESVSGFTTTGATILNSVEVLPGSLQLWRHLTQWLGGIGVLLLGIAILPLIGAGGMQLYRADFDATKSENLKVRIRETAWAAGTVYAGLTIGAIIALRLAGMSALEAICHAFSTVSTGGFSTRSASIAGFGSAAIETIIVVFVLLSGLSFIQHYRLWIGHRLRPVLSDVEVRGYFTFAAVGTVVIAATLLLTRNYSFGGALGSAVFHVSAMMSTAGFIGTDLQFWHPLAQLALLALMFIGGTTASTAGGLKTSRMLLLGSVVNREFRQMAERRAVLAVRLGGEVMQEKTIRGLLNLIYLAFVVNFVACLFLAASGIDVLSAIAAVAGCMFNVGPGVAVVNPAVRYAQMPETAKWVLSVCMIAGRVEFYALFVVCTPAFWKR